VKRGEEDVRRRSRQKSGIVGDGDGRKALHCRGRKIADAERLKDLVLCRRLDGLPVAE
jgi:hypothetical protein